MSDGLKHVTLSLTTNHQSGYNSNHDSIIIILMIAIITTMMLFLIITFIMIGIIANTMIVILIIVTGQLLIWIDVLNHLVFLFTLLL